ncbi:tyrosine-type recombinase/integrase [Sphingomonas immobilis]|uniref:Integrase arm-type DNA-binding domain-containing protein n=1 Tax=Sphingomonas immobilis TaxID=3063997 RepID=A0ABT9A1J3_9SPHN|nr:integrase arm-type DNA-binding domain-containing protein [Sphingomonas sp. CA1-15]MDO7843423.1 integrase arm-type DNA-binding domain-containing protein [Sphingomonas sp. CA1-15]
MALTDTQARKAETREKDYKLADSGGLYLFVTSRGFKSWRLKYRFGGKEKRLIFGPYPEVSLAKAREARDRARILLRDHRDPALEERKRKMAAHAAAGATFERVAKEWHDAQKPRWSPLQAKKVIQAFERDVFKEIGALPLLDIDGPMILKMLRKVEARGAIDTAKRIRQHVSGVFGYGIAEGLVAADPAATIGRALKPIGKKGKQPAVRTLEAARQLLKDMDVTTAGPLTKLASRLLALTLVRPGIVRAARWSEFEGIDWSDPDAPSPDAIWRVPAERMKLELENKDDEAFEHIVPLQPQAISVLHAVRRLTGRIDYLFPSIRSTAKPMSENTIGYMYARNGYSGRHVPHGWRATFSTLMNEIAVNEQRPDDRAQIDAMLAHKPKGLSGSEMAYNRAKHMGRRRELANEWANILTADLAPPSDLLSGQTR